MSKKIDLLVFLKKAIETRFGKYVAERTEENKFQWETLKQLYDRCLGNTHYEGIILDENGNPGICTNPNCHRMRTTLVEPDAWHYECEECGQKTVNSLSVIAGYIKCE